MVDALHVKKNFQQNLPNTDRVSQRLHFERNKKITGLRTFGRYIEVEPYNLMNEL
jgi:hypothetical protein